MKKLFAAAAVLGTLLCMAGMTNDADAFGIATGRVGNVRFGFNNGFHGDFNRFPARFVVPYGGSYVAPSAVFASPYLASPVLASPVYCAPAAVIQQYVVQQSYQVPVVTGMSVTQPLMPAPAVVQTPVPVPAPAPCPAPAPVPAQTACVPTQAAALPAYNMYQSVASYGVGYGYQAAIPAYSAYSAVGFAAAPVYGYSLPLFYGGHHHHHRAAGVIGGTNAIVTPAAAVVNVNNRGDLLARGRATNTQVITPGAVVNVNGRRR